MGFNSEIAAREYFVQLCDAFVGVTEGSPIHRWFVDIWNRWEDKPRTMPADAPWCALFPSAVSIVNGLTSVVLPEISCNMMKQLYQRDAHGMYITSNIYTPQVGDLVMYDWQQDNTLDHVGIIKKYESGTLYVIEGNIADRVGYREIRRLSPQVIGFCVPDYKSMIGVDPVETTYKYVDDVPEWARPTILKFVRTGVIVGSGNDGEKVIVNLTDAMIRTLIMCERMINVKLEGL